MTSREVQVASVLALYPQADPGYVRYCLQQHPDRAVEEVLHKMAHLNFSHFPTLRRTVSPNSTRAKNSAMRRLVRLFPEVDLAWLRHQIQQHEHSHFYSVLDTILVRPYPQRQLPNNPRQRRQQRLQHQQSVSSSSSFSQTTSSIPCPMTQAGHIKAPNSDTEYEDDSDEESYLGSTEALIEPWEYIRSAEYVKSVRRQLYNEFPEVWKSTIKAVMAENNFDYLRTYDRLVALESENSWSRWFSGVFSFVRRAKITKTGEDPPEFLDDLASFHRRVREQQSIQDQAVAREVNDDEYRTHKQTIECGCCFSDFCFEEMASCQEGHLFCKECIQRYVQEGLFGQGDLGGGAAREQGGERVAHAIHCIEGSGCKALFSEAMLEWALTTELYEQYTRLAFQTDLERSGLEMVRCPFCDYAEVDEPLRVVWLPWQRKLWSSTLLPSSSDFYNHVYRISTLILLTHALAPLVSLATFLIGFFVHTLMLIVLLLPLLLVLIPMTVMHGHVQTAVDGMVRNIQVRRRGQAFHCKGCNRTSCLNCAQERKPFHRCHENLAEGLRLHVERAMTEAVKRTCPKCNLSFVKESGCNKMRCSCGYVMCFLCRKDIREESYKHFCNHFRALAGPCTQCNKCDLYMVEKDEEAAKKAASTARAEYLRMHPKAREHLQNDHTIIGTPPDNTLEDLASYIRLKAENIFELLFIESSHN